MSVFGLKENHAIAAVAGDDRTGPLLREGGFYVDPWRPVDRAVVTHAHADHACGGCGRYLTTRPARACSGPGSGGREGRCHRLRRADRRSTASRSRSTRPGTSSARRRSGSSTEGEVWVVSGDYKVEPDPTCAPFEPVRCHVFVTESTFGLPIYRWPPQAEVFDDDQRLVAGQPGRRARRACSSATPWARRSGCWRGSTRRSGRSTLPRRGREAEPGLSRRRRSTCPRRPTSAAAERGTDWAGP